jgi:hypothetical protein
MRKLLIVPYTLEVRHSFAVFAVRAWLITRREYVTAAQRSSTRILYVVNNSREKAFFLNLVKSLSEETYACSFYCFGRFLFDSLASRSCSAKVIFDVLARLLVAYLYTQGRCTLTSPGL